MKKIYTSPEVELDLFNKSAGNITTSFEVPNIEIEDIPILDSQEF